MPYKYPTLSSHEITRILESHGFITTSQKGSHRKLKKDARTVIVPIHSEIAIGTLKSIINQSGLSLGDFTVK